MKPFPARITYEFVPHGSPYQPMDDTLILDVGMACTPGIIDHHQPDAPHECAASLIVKNPRLVLDHIPPFSETIRLGSSPSLRIITHFLPDFDAISAVFLALKLLTAGEIDVPMRSLADYAYHVDSAALPKNLDLSATPYALLRALARNIRLSEPQASLTRMEQGLEFMDFLYAKAAEGHDIVENPSLFAGNERYEKAVRQVKGDYMRFLNDLERAEKLDLYLPLSSGRGAVPVSGLMVCHPQSLLLKEWAHRDRDHSPKGQGFSFLATQYAPDKFILGVDPEKNLTLRGLGDLLNAKEKEVRKAQGGSHDIPWYEGNAPLFDFRIVASPRGGTALSFTDIHEILNDFSLSQKIKR